MELGLRERVACVAGSSRGIGRAIARAFLAEGSRVVVTGREVESLAETEAALRAEFGGEQVLAVAGDLSQPSGIAEALARTRERWGALDCLVGCIGSGTAKSGWELEESDWASAFEKNLSANRRLAEAVLPEMTRAGRGSIVFIASIVGVESVNAPLTYSAAKAALVSYSKNLAREVGPSGVRVNCVAPGNILFPRGSWEKKVSERPDHWRQYVETEVPLKRFGAPGEIADLVVFLSSERASFITGACVVADGGQTRGY